MLPVCARPQLLQKPSLEPLRFDRWHRKLTGKWPESRQIHQVNANKVFEEASSTRSPKEVSKKTSNWNTCFKGEVLRTRSDNFWQVIASFTYFWNDFALWSLPCCSSLSSFGGEMWSLAKDRRSSTLWHEIKNQIFPWDLFCEILDLDYDV